MRTYWICDTRTGAKLGHVQPSAGSFRRVFCGSGAGQHTLKLVGKRTRQQWRDLTTPWTRTLTVSENGVMIYAGLIKKRPYEFGSREIVLEHVDVREIFRRRYPFGVTSYWANEANHVPGKLVLTNLSKRAIAARVVQESLIGPWDIYSLPIVLPSTSEAGPYSATYENYLFRSTFDILEDLQSEDGGPDIDFAPRWSSSGTLEWVLETGTPAAPQITKGTHDFNMTVPKPKLTELQVLEDATDQLTGIFNVGLGSEADMSVGGTGTGVSGLQVALDIVQSHKEEADQPTLTSYSLAGLKTLSHPTVQYEAKVMTTPTLNPATMPVASMLRLNFKDDPWLNDGWATMRLIGFAGDTTRKVSLTIQSLVGA